MSTQMTHACAATGPRPFAEGAEAQYAPDLELEPVHLDIDLAVDIDAATAKGTVTTTVLARRPGARALTLDAVGFEDVAVTDPDGHLLTSDYDGERLRLDWPDGVPEGETRRVAVRYRVTHPATGLFFSRPDAAYPKAPRFAATDHETERARHWLPCVDLPTVRTPLDFHLRAASGLTILANGVLVEDVDHADGTHTAHWKLEQRCPSYILCFALGEFVRLDDGDFEGRPLSYFTAAPFDAGHLGRTFGRTKDLLGWMTRKLAMDFPFPKYFQFALPGLGGAMENISLVSWDDQFLLDEALATEIGQRVEQVNAHEMAHSYFGDLLVVRDFSHAWLKESWATFMEQCWLEDTYGDDEGRYLFFRHGEDYFTEADGTYLRPVVDRHFRSSWQLFDRHLYPGGAARLHVLRAEVGEASFWAGVRRYLEAHAHGVVETSDFRQALEQASGRSLGRFFDQWLHQKGYPKLKVTFSHDPEAGMGRFDIEQTQADAEAGIPVFHLNTQVGFTVDGKTERVPVALTEAKHTVMVPMAKAPEQVRFDPEATVLCKLDFNPGEPRLRRQLAEAPDVIGRIQAARTLLGTGRPGAVAAVGDALATEPFWGVRVEMADALGKAGTEAALETLLARLPDEPDPRGVAAILAALGRYRDPRVVEAVERRVDAGLPPRATAAAYKALGAQRHDAPGARLEAAAGRDGFQGIAQGGAFEALAETRRAEYLPLLRERARHGATSNRARPAAVRALGALGAWLEAPKRREAVEACEDLLRDPVENVRRAAVQALEALQATEALGALEAHRATLSRQHQVALDGILARIRGSGDPKVAGLGKQVETLTEQGRRLEDSDPGPGGPPRGRWPEGLGARRGHAPAGGSAGGGLPTGRGPDRRFRGLGSGGGASGSTGATPRAPPPARAEAAAARLGPL